MRDYSKSEMQIAVMLKIIYFCNDSVIILVNNSIYKFFVGKNKWIFT